MAVLILGGTSEARALAGALHAAGVAVTTSLAGRVPEPRLPPGEVRIGGFGGPDGLADWLARNGITAVVDASHPFAQRISASATDACAASGVELLRLDRPPWRERDGDRWRWAANHQEAAAAIEGLGRRVLLTTGHGELAAFARVNAWFLIRCITPPSPPLPGAHEVLLDRGPFRLDAELALIERHAIDLVVTKDSGGGAAKLEAARSRGIPVIVIRRPVLADAAAVDSVERARRWVLQRGG